MNPRISLCICTYNRPVDLDKCLSSVYAAHPRPNEVIVSDDSADAQPAQAVVARYPGVIYQRGPSQGLGANRNACLRAVTQDYVLFIDDDVCVEPDFFARAVSVLASLPERTIVTGYELNHRSEPVCKVTPHNPDFWGFQHVLPLGDYHALVINSTFFPAALFESIKFDEKLRYGSDEIDVARHAISCGYRIQYSEDLYVHHYPSPVNRDEYQSYTEASRLYATFKAYWHYEKAIVKSSIFLLLAPPKLCLALVRRTGFRGCYAAFKSTSLALRYIMTP
ncbi:glycosyltransferase family 2 protein [filamentous cyanobacterium LEGE 11480]|uniref:Glycosyltransferase family 2 protein n=1 Tax=Romeriopsis navalis LEGE 11480 TaxID=2777977 RepID=A0A928Z2Z1_9CYAN|nr:glycosyltransferase [Romeriopsis navalis]MBE9029537.1 glycosyltransferase family 2 protein [Romeriopsis navalis LEGE 11480]